MLFRIFSVFVGLVFVHTVHADDHVTTQVPFFLPSEINVPAAKMCEAQNPIHAEICNTLNDMKEAMDGKPLTLNFKDDQNHDIVVRFHFGFARTTYQPTTLTVNDSQMHVVIKDFKVMEITSAICYSPEDWKKSGNPLEWIDEPTNLFDLSVEKDNNVFYVTIFHPKYLKPRTEQAQVTGVIAGQQVMRQMEINSSDVQNPTSLHISEFQNTHLQVDWQIGYGRKLKIFDAGKWGELSYTPHVHVGITTGSTNVIMVGTDGSLQQRIAPNEIQGYNISVGHMLQYEIGRVDLFVDQKFTYEHLRSTFMDGTAQYDMKYMPVTFGVGIKLFRIHRE